MRRVLDPLRLMGARAGAMPGDVPPLTIHGGGLTGIRYPLPVPSAQVKSCVLLAGLYADSMTSVGETIPTRDHTERALSHFGATVRTDGAGSKWNPHPIASPVAARRSRRPVGGRILPCGRGSRPGGGSHDSTCRAEPAAHGSFSRTSQEAGLDIAVDNELEHAGEARGDLRVRYSGALLERALPPIEGGLTAALIDEIPVLAVLGAHVAGGLVIADARELRVKESDRIAAIATNLRAMGAAVVESPDGMRIHGGGGLRGARIETRGDHRIAMAFAVAGLAAGGETRIAEAECADVSFPGFFEQLASVCNRG